MYAMCSPYVWQAEDGLFTNQLSSLASDLQRSAQFLLAFNGFKESLKISFTK